MPIGDNYANSDDGYVRRENQLLNRIDKRMNAARRALGLTPTEPDILRRPYSPWLNLVVSGAHMEAPRNNLTDSTFLLVLALASVQKKHSHLTHFGQINSKFMFRSGRFSIISQRFSERSCVRWIHQTTRSSSVRAALIRSYSGTGYPRMQSSIKASRKSVCSTELTCLSVMAEITAQMKLSLPGKPIIVMPVGGEQADNASRVVYLGVGKRIDIATFSENNCSTVWKKYGTRRPFKNAPSVL